MTNPHEPSYYEIALTNRQVIVAFVILLLCLIAAFFSGVWIGRENGVRAAEQMVRNEPPQQAEEQQEGQNLEEFEFFESEQPAGTPAAPPEPEPAQTAASPEEDTTLAEDFGNEDEEEPAAEEDVETTAEAVPARPQDPGQGRPGPARVTFPQDRKGEEDTLDVPAQPRAERIPAEAKTAEPAGTASAARLVIQVFSSPEKEQAERIRARLAGGGHKAFLSPVEVAGRTMYRVRIGPFDSRERAQTVAEQVRKGYKLDTWVTGE